MRKKVLLLFLCGLAMSACGTKKEVTRHEVVSDVIRMDSLPSDDDGSDVGESSGSGYSEADAPVMDVAGDLGNEADADVPHGLQVTDSLYGVTMQVPDYLDLDAEGLMDHHFLDYYGSYSDEPDVYHVGLEIISSVWDLDAVKPLADVTPDDWVLECDGEVDEDGYAMGVGHIFFTDGRSNAGEHEFQALVYVTAKGEELTEQTLREVMGSLDFSDFYFDNFAD